jgi:hypothetical protein
VRQRSPRADRLRTPARSSRGELVVLSLGIETVDTQITETKTHLDIWVFLVPESGSVDTQIAAWRRESRDGVTG